MSKADEAHALLEELIESGGLEPGSFCTEAGLMDLLGIGRTPLREAVQRLGRDRLVRIRPGRGLEIPSNSVEEQLLRLEVRRVMEALAVALAAERATPVELVGLEALGEDLVGVEETGSYMKLLRQTQQRLGSATHNEYLVSSLTPLQALSRRFWLANLSDAAPEIESSRRLYLGLLRGVVARDAEASRSASLALNDHLVTFTLSVASRHARSGR